MTSRTTIVLGVIALLALVLFGLSDPYCVAQLTHNTHGAIVTPEDDGL